MTYARTVCARCEKGPEPPYTWSQAVGEYAGTLREAIHRLKYNGKTALAAPLGHILACSLDTPTPLLTQALPSYDAVVPIPLHSSRLRQRGFNQAERVARIVALERGWTLDTRGLRRIRSTRSQTTLTVEERAANVKGAFIATRCDYFAGRSVLLIDDVLTTTSTVREASRVIMAAGATRVGVITLARSV